MKIHFKMLINDGEKYYISDNPGIALCDYVYMRGLESIDDNRFWEEQLAHYQAHKAFNFDLDLVASSSIANISNAIAERIGFDKSKFAESYPRIYLLEDGEFVEIITPTVCISTLSKYYDIREDLHIFFMLSNQAGDIWVEDGLRYYMQSKEAGRHHLPHIHVDYRHESSATVSLYDGEMIEGDIPKKVMKRVKAKVLNNKKYLMECWNKLTDGLRVDVNAYFGPTPLHLEQYLFYLSFLSAISPALAPSKVGPGFRPELRSAYSRTRCLPHPRVERVSLLLWNYVRLIVPW